MSANEVNARYDASYRNSENTQKLLGRSLSLGQACGIIAVALYGPDIPMEEAGSIVHIWHILHILHIWHVQHIYIIFGCLHVSLTMRLENHFTLMVQATRTV